MVKDFKKIAIFGLMYGILVYILSRGGSSDRSWAMDAFASTIVAIIFILILYLLLRLNPFDVFEKTTLKNWKQRVVYILIIVMLSESLIIAKTLISEEKLDVVSLILSGLGIAVAISIAITIAQRKSEVRRK